MGPNAHRKFIFLPRWVEILLQRQGQSPTVLQDLSKANEYLSWMDIACVDYLNENAKRLLGFDNSDCGTNDTGLGVAGEGIKIYIHHVAPLRPMVEQVLMDRLFEAEGHFEEGKRKTHHAYVSDQEIVFVVIYPSCFIGDTRMQDAQSLTKDIFKIIHDFEGFDRLVQHACWREHFSNQSIQSAA
jgi:hypothetical protein